MRDIPRALLFLSATIIFTSSLFAGGQGRAVFSDQGLRIFTKLDEELPENFLALSPMIQEPCPENPAKVCIPWKLVLAPGMDIQTVLPSILTGFNVWNQRQDLKLNFVYNGLATVAGVPYRVVPGSDPVQIEKDEFGNEIVDGDFLVSFVPPPEMSFGAGGVSKIIQYLVPQQQQGLARISWGGIYLNPQLQPNQQYSLPFLIASEAGRLVGLSSSAMKRSLLYPLLPATPQAPQLTEDDLQWAREIYGLSPTGPQFGRMSGTVHHGLDDKPIPGAVVYAFSDVKREEFSSTADFTLASYQALSDEDGIFKFPAMQPGSYFVVVGSVRDFGLNKNQFDDWMAAVGFDNELGVEFYDGGERESNQEPSITFSPVLVMAAATVHVAAGQETERVDIISNVADPSIEAVYAVGSTNETLSQYQFNVADRIRTMKEAEQAQQPQRQSSRMACALSVDSSSLGSSQIAELFALGLMALFAAGLRREWFRFGCR